MRTLENFLSLWITIKLLAINIPFLQATPVFVKVKGNCTVLASTISPKPLG